MYCLILRVNLTIFFLNFMADVCAANYLKNVGAAWYIKIILAVLGYGVQFLMF